MGGEVDDDWCVEDPNEEWYNPTKRPKGTWMPEGKVILELLERIQKEKILELKWVCPGRRPPASEEPEEEMETEADFDEEEVEEEKEEEKSALFGEFDFDDAPSEMSTKITPRRTPGSGKSPRPQKRVACMDNVLNKIRTQRRQNEAARASKGLGIRGRRTPIYNTGTPRGRLGPSLSQTGSTAKRQNPFDFLSSKQSPTASTSSSIKPVAMEVDRSLPARPATSPASSSVQVSRSEGVVSSSPTQNRGPFHPQSSTHSSVPLTGATTTTTTPTSAVTSTSKSHVATPSHIKSQGSGGREGREPLPKLLLKIPPPSANQQVTSTLLPPGYSRASQGGQGTRKSPTGQSGGQKSSPSSSKPKTPPLSSAGPKTPPGYQNPPKTPPLYYNPPKTPPTSSPFNKSPVPNAGPRPSQPTSTSPKSSSAFPGQPKTSSAFPTGPTTSPGFMPRGNPFQQQPYGQGLSRASPQVSHPPSSNVMSHTTSSSNQTQNPPPRMPHMSQSLPRMPPVSQYSPRTSPVSQNPPRTPPMSQHPPRTPPISQNPPRTPPISQNPQRNPLSQNLPRTPPISHNPHRNPLSQNPPRTAQNPPRTPLVSQNPPRTPPISHNPPRTPPILQNPPRTPPISQNPQRSHHSPPAALPSQQAPQRPFSGQQSPGRPLHMPQSPGRMPPMRPLGQIHPPRPPFQTSGPPHPYQQARPKTPPAYHTVVSRGAQFAPPVSSHQGMPPDHRVSTGGPLPGGGNPTVAKTSPTGQRQPPVPMMTPPGVHGPHSVQGPPPAAHLGAMGGHHPADPHRPPTS